MISPPRSWAMLADRAWHVLLSNSHQLFLYRKQNDSSRSNQHRCLFHWWDSDILDLYFRRICFGGSFFVEIGSWARGRWWKKTAFFFIQLNKLWKIVEWLIAWLVLLSGVIVQLRFLLYRWIRWGGGRRWTRMTFRLSKRRDRRRRW